jgi:hypothetical protein
MFGTKIIRKKFSQKKKGKILLISAEIVENGNSQLVKICVSPTPLGFITNIQQKVYFG